VDQLTCSTTTKQQKNSRKPTYTTQASYEDRLKLAREKLLADMPKTQPMAEGAERKEHVRVPALKEASYDARFKTIRDKLLSEQPKPQWIGTFTPSANASGTTQIQPLILTPQQMQETSVSTTQRLQEQPTSQTKNPGMEQADAIFEFHKNEVLGNDNTGHSTPYQDTPPMQADTAPMHHTPTPTTRRGLPISPKTHIRVTFTPHALPDGVTGVAGENATISDGWVQKNAVDHYLDLQEQAKKYAAHQAALYNTVQHDV